MDLNSHGLLVALPLLIVTNGGMYTPSFFSIVRWN